MKEKVEFAKNAIRENRDDERFLKVLDIYVRNFLSLDEFETELKSFSTKVQKTETCQRYFEFIKYARINVPGKQCIDFEMKGHNGETIKFSDVYKNTSLFLLISGHLGVGRVGQPCPPLKRCMKSIMKKTSK